MSATDNRQQTTDHRSLKIAFHSSYLGYRGTEIALMDYAEGNKQILGNQSFFLMPWREGVENHPVTQRIKGIAPLRLYRTAEEREGILREEKADFFYCIKNGFNDGVFSKQVPTGNHAIFRESEFHGDVYAYVSPWLSEVMAYGKAPWVPHMVKLAETEENLRAEGGGRRTEDGGRRTEDSRQWADIAVPKDAMVFGRHGGDDSFDIPWVQEAVVETAKKNPDIWFLFLNTREFRGAAGLPNIIFLPATADPILKRRFFNTCDAMLHGRQRGETFGLSCLEFAMLGKPVLTYSDSPERAHLEILGDSAVRYDNPQQLKELLVQRGQRSEAGGRTSVVGHQWSVVGGRKTEDRGQSLEDGGQKTDACTRPPASGLKKEIDRRYKDYQPEAVMQKFKEVFLS